MAKKDTWIEKIDALNAGISDPDIKAILKVCSSNRMYPKDCITNGGLELLAKRILAYEQRILELGGTL